MPFDATDFQAEITTPVTATGLNIENIQRVRDVIHALDPDRFDMSEWSVNRDSGDDATADQLAHDCGTAGCIGGWTSAVFKYRRGMSDDTQSFAAAKLGLTEAQGRKLFMPSLFEDGVSWVGSDITQAEAVMTLDHLIATGEVSWAPVVAAREVA